MTSGTAARTRPARTHGALASLAVLVVLAALAAQSLGPRLFQRDELESGIAVQLRALTGLDIRMRRARFDLLPRPRVVAEAISIRDGSGAIAVEAESLSGGVRLLPLIVGRIELSFVALRRPAIVVDAAALGSCGGCALGRAFLAAGDDEPAQRLGTLTLEDGTLRVLRGGSAPLVLPGIDAALSWSSLPAAASITGRVSIGGERALVAATLGSPLALLRGGTSSLDLRGHAASFDLAARGVLTGSVPPASDGAAASRSAAFEGHVSATAASLAQLLDRAGMGAPLPAPFADASLEGDARLLADGHGLSALDLHGLTVRADGNGWEGTLAYRRAPRPLVAATLATDQLSLAPFTAGLPAPLDAGGGWSHRPLPRLRLGDVELDLRVSAAQLLLPPLAVQDAALSVISRGQGLEIALIDGRLAGGVAKLRLSLGRGGDGLALGGSGTLVGADAAILSRMIAGRQVAAGTLSLAVNGDSGGDSAAALVQRLAGSMKASLADGEVAGPAALGGRLSVGASAAAVRFAGGVATIADASLSDAAMRLRGRGTLDLRSRSLDLEAAIRDRGGAGAGCSTLVVSGRLDAPSVRSAPAGPAC